MSVGKIKAYLLHKPLRFFITMAVCLISIGIVMGFTIFNDTELNNEKSVKSYYAQKLEQLDVAIMDVPVSLEISNNVGSDLEKYNDALVNILNPCAYITDGYEKASSQQISPELKNNLNKSNQLCTDLESVAVYSQSLYRTLRPYLILDSPKWGSSTDGDFRARLDNFVETTKNTKAALGKINNSKIQDPALAELTTQLDQAIELAAEIQKVVEQNQVSRATELAAQLTDQTNQDKKDFLLARNYFWNNTIGITSLARSVQKLRAQF